VQVTGESPRFCHAGSQLQGAVVLHILSLPQSQLLEYYLVFLPALFLGLIPFVYLYYKAIGDYRKEAGNIYSGKEGTLKPIRREIEKICLKKIKDYGGRVKMAQFDMLAREISKILSLPERRVKLTIARAPRAGLNPRLRSKDANKLAMYLAVEEDLHLAEKQKNCLLESFSGFQFKTDCPVFALEGEGCCVEDNRFGHEPTSSACNYLFNPKYRYSCTRTSGRT
jgi:hypothetical protein